MILQQKPRVREIWEVKILFDPRIRYLGPRHIIVEKNQSPIAYWDLEKEKMDELVVIIGGGPSHGSMDERLLKNIQFIAVNSACKKVRNIAKEKDLLYFSDNSWSERFLGHIQTWPGKVITSNRNTKVRLRNLVERLDINSLTEFMEVKSDYVQASSGHTSACLAARLGAKKIVLIGFECKAIDGRTHGHDDYKTDDLAPFRERYLLAWNELSIRFKEFGIKVINSTPDSEIKDFEFIPLEQAIKNA